jgi:hypothetical protein
MPVIAEIFVKSKSTPLVAEMLEQLRASLPVSVKLIVPDALVAAAAAKVRVGGVPSTVTTRVDVAVFQYRSEVVGP